MSGTMLDAGEAGVIAVAHAAVTAAARAMAAMTVETTAGVVGTTGKTTPAAVTVGSNNNNKNAVKAEHGARASRWRRAFGAATASAVVCVDIGQRIAPSKKRTTTAVVVNRQHFR
jgi:hypothetical protein